MFVEKGLLTLTLYERIFSLKITKMRPTLHCLKTLIHELVADM